MAQPEHPHGAPPGQSGEHPEHPEHPHGGPPGQEGKPDKPDEETEEELPLEPTHPIVDPEAPYVEHHGEDEKEGTPA
jgi:hypothetical protein